jgi:hypothetical protein
MAMDFRSRIFERRLVAFAMQPLITTRAPRRIFTDLKPCEAVLCPSRSLSSSLPLVVMQVHH